MKIIMFGMPGAGKDTHSHMLAEVLGIEHFTTGGILRSAAKEDPKLAEFLATGQLVNDEMMQEIIENALTFEKEVFCGISYGVKDFILNGYPRNIKQAEFLHAL